MRQQRRLLVLNFTMDEDHPVLGFGVSWVRALAPYVDKLHVVTGSVGRFDLPSNVSVDTVKWVPGQHLKNARKLQRVARAALNGFSPDAVFTHMAAPYAAVLGPDIRRRRLHHVLWYAHASRSKGLVLAYPWVSYVATSSAESCPFRGNKVQIIGQGIDVDLFCPTFRNYDSVLESVHWGRADPSKRLGYLVAVVAKVREDTGLPIGFTQVGSPATPEAADAWGILRNKYKSSGVLEWVPGVKRDELPNLAASQDVFLHAFIGSLDKAPLEAAAMGIPVLSENVSVRRELGSWPSGPDLAVQLQSFVEATPVERKDFALLQQERVREKHSLEALSRRLVNLLYPPKPF